MRGIQFVISKIADIFQKKYHIYNRTDEIQTDIHLNRRTELSIINTLMELLIFCTKMPFN